VICRNEGRVFFFFLVLSPFFIIKEFGNKKED
jgi:hypothetical protein